MKYRFWNPKKKEMTYLQICFPTQYGGDCKVYLKDMIAERDGVRFCFILMHQILQVQIAEEEAEQDVHGNTH